MWFFDLFSYFIGKITFFTGAIVGGESFPKQLKKEEEEGLLSRYFKGKKAEKGSKDYLDSICAKNELISHNMRLVAHIAKKYNSPSFPQDDLISVGSIGLIKAINTYSIDKNTSLSTFASRCIENEILMLFRANKKHMNDVSISEPVGIDKEGNELSLIDLLFGDVGDVFSLVDKNVQKKRLMEKIKPLLSKREFTILCYRFGLDGCEELTQREVAKKLKISRSYISRIEKKALEILRENLNKNDFCF